MVLDPSCTSPTSRVQSRTRPVNVLTTHSTWLMGSLVALQRPASGQRLGYRRFARAALARVQENDSPRRARERPIWRPPRRLQASLRSQCTPHERGAGASRSYRAPWCGAVIKLPQAEIERTARLIAALLKPGLPQGLPL